MQATPNAIQLTPLQRLAERALGWLAPLLLAVLASDMLQGLHTIGIDVIKPRDFTVLLSVLCLLLALILRPRFCASILLMLALPILRLFDAAMLRRYVAADDDSVIVMKQGTSLLLILVMVLVIATDKGTEIMVRAAIGVILLTFASVMYEFMGRATFSPIVGRLAGFGGHPNCPGIYINLMLGVIFTLKPDFRRDMVLLAMAVAAIGLTLSRSGIAMLVGIVVCYIFVHGRKHVLALVLTAAVAVPLLTAGVVVLTSSAKQGMGRNTNVEDRLKAIFEFDTDKLASQERMKDLMDAWEEVGKSPLVGFGTGVGTGAGLYIPHNEVVALWLDHGIIGPILFIGVLLLLTIRSGFQQGTAICCLIPLWGLVPASHNLTETVTYYMALIVAGHALSSRRFEIRMSRPADQPSIQMA